jgi:uncharacterized protein DUF222/HNH endonuclease
VAALGVAIDAFCAQPDECRTPEEVGIDVSALTHYRDRLELEIAKQAAAFAATGESEEQGFISPVHWIRVHCHMTSGAAADRIAVGEMLDDLPKSVAAVKEGAIGFAHLALMARTATALAEAESPRTLAEEPLLKKARELNVGRFRNFCLHARHAADPEGYAAEQAQGVEARELSLTGDASGMVWVRGILDAEGGAALRTALEPLARLKGKGDHRCRARRLADALVDLSMHALDSGLIPQHSSQRTHLQVTATLETLRGLPGAQAAELEFSLPISAKSVERLACDCSLTRIILGSDSEVIEVGRTKRTVSGPRRKALNARDRHCRWPGCDRPPSYSSAHHLVHWIHGGSSDLPNLALLCYRHHWLVHEGRWQLVKTDDSRMLAVPPTLDVYEQLARGPGDNTAG